MGREQINIIQLYNRLATVSARIPEYDENKKGFDMCLMLFKEGLKDCPSVRHLTEIEDLKQNVAKNQLKIKELRETILNLKTK